MKTISVTLAIIAAWLGLISLGLNIYNYIRYSRYLRKKDKIEVEEND